MATMRRSHDRILTTHTGSLPRPGGAALPGTPELGGETADPEVVREATKEIVAHQVEVGIDVVNDGEMSKPSYSTYVVDRLTGFEHAETLGRKIPYSDEFPEYFARFGDKLTKNMTNPVCVGPVSYRDHSAVDTDIANLKAAGACAGAEELFMTAAIASYSSWTAPT
jgi:5-methyltetrahydropteroyltriglutamate--homocysteine methyltransferase